MRQSGQGSWVLAVGHAAEQREAALSWGRKCRQFKSNARQIVGRSAIWACVVGAVAFGFLAGCRTTLPPEFEDCRAESYAVLESAGIDADRVRRFTSTPQRVFFRPFHGADDDRIVGYSNWLEIEGCEGPVVLRFSRFCQLRNIHVRGACGPGTEGR